MPFNLEELVELCREQQAIYIYGAGKNARRIYHFLAYSDILVKGFIVSEAANNPETLFGLPVMGIDTFQETAKYLILVPASSVSQMFKDVFNDMVARGIKSALFLPYALLESMKEELYAQNNKRLFDNSKYVMEKNLPVEKAHIIFSQQKQTGEVCCWRMKSDMLYENGIKSIGELFEKESALEEFERQYGTYHVFHYLQEGTKADTSCAVYMAQCHVDKQELQGQYPSWVKPIQVGASLVNLDICEIKDNQGENISDRNGNYSECTALYWMWKNAPHTDYIGLCHYRRHFNLAEDDILRLGAADVDVLVTSPTFVHNSIKEFFMTFIPEADFNTMLKVIEDIRPEYLSTAHEFLKARFYAPCNLSIMKREIFDEYAELLFSITLEIDRRYEALELYRKDRFMGYIAECLLGIFLMKNKERLKIAYADMKYYP